MKFLKIEKGTEFLNYIKHGYIRIKFLGIKIPFRFKVPNIISESDIPKPLNPIRTCGKIKDFSHILNRNWS